MDAKTREDTWTQIDSIFNTCDSIESADDLENMYLHLSNGYLYMAMTDYPNPANFLEPMPGYPVNESVKPFADIDTLDEYQRKNPSSGSNTDSDGLSDRELSLMEALANSTNIYFNYTGQYACTNLSDTEGTGSLDGFGWNVLACNEMFMPTGFGEDSMFIPLAIDYDANTRYCQETFGLTPDYDWALRYFGGFNITRDFMALTNIVFSNGELDPWRAGGLNSNVSVDGSAIALYIEGGAHHLDLRTPEDADPPLITQARDIEMTHIKKWISEYQD